MKLLVATLPFLGLGVYVISTVGSPEFLFSSIISQRYNQVFTKINYKKYTMTNKMDLKCNEIISKEIGRF